MGSEAALEAVRQAEQKYRSIFEHCVIGIFQTTPDGQYLSANPALARMYGYSSSSELMADVVDIGASLYVDAQRREDFKRLIEARGVVEGFESEIRRKDGTRIWISEKARAVRGESGAVVSYEGTVENITERKRSEFERQATTDIVHAISATDGIDDMLASAHFALKKVLNAENCFIALYEPSSGVFHFPFFVDRFDSTPAPKMVWRSCAAY